MPRQVILTDTVIAGFVVGGACRSSVTVYPAAATAARLYGPGSMGTEWRILTECKKAGGALTRSELRDALGRNAPRSSLRLPHWQWQDW